MSRAAHHHPYVLSPTREERETCPDTISVLIPTGTQASPPNVGNDTFDSDGVPDGTGYSVVAGVPDIFFANDFGFYKPAAR